MGGTRVDRSGERRWRLCRVAVFDPLHGVLVLRSEPLTADEVAGPEWAAWYALTPLERWEASQRLWIEYLALGGSLDPEVDTQSPFWSTEDLRGFALSRGVVLGTNERADVASNPEPKPKA